MDDYNICAEFSKLSEYGLSFVENCQEQVRLLAIMTTMKNNKFLTLLFILNKVVNFKGVFRVLRGIFMKSE